MASAKLTAYHYEGETTLITRFWATESLKAPDRDDKQKQIVTLQAELDEEKKNKDEKSKRPSTDPAPARHAKRARTDDSPVEQTCRHTIDKLVEQGMVDIGVHVLRHMDGSYMFIEASVGGLPLPKDYEKNVHADAQNDMDALNTLFQFICQPLPREVREAIDDTPDVADAKRYHQYLSKLHGACVYLHGALQAAVDELCDHLDSPDAGSDLPQTIALLHSTFGLGTFMNLLGRITSSPTPHPIIQPVGVLSLSSFYIKLSEIEHHQRSSRLKYSLPDTLSSEQDDAWYMDTTLRGVLNGSAVQSPEDTQSWMWQEVTKAVLALVRVTFVISLVTRSLLVVDCRVAKTPSDDKNLFAGVELLHSTIALFRELCTTAHGIIDFSTAAQVNFTMAEDAIDTSCLKILTKATLDELKPDPGDEPGFLAQHVLDAKDDSWRAVVDRQKTGSPST
ncbi:uncharacterized protein PG986_006430 [Apiospora aurea]|uniref:Uncharacterized protein n=1 Tax=Apiospora aurea TaxID=335848 RepID=A0ABR1QKR8_9PEZI